MRILFLAEAPSPYAREWAEHLAAVFGHDVHLASLQPCDAPLTGVTFHPLGRHVGRLSYLLALPATRRLAHRLGPDLTVAYRVTSYGVLAAAAGLHPLSLAAQGQYIAFPPTSLPKRALARYALARADLVTSWGVHMTQNMVKLGCDPGKIRTIAYGIDTERFRIDPDRPRPGSPPKLLTTRALRRDYNHEQILRALPDVAAIFPGVVWTAVGEGPERERLAGLARRLGVGRNLDLPGRVPSDRLLALLRECDVYLSAVRTDGVSASLLEAMACGAWPIVTDNEANRLWIRPGETGDLVAPGDAPGMAHAILRALRDPRRTGAALEANRDLVVTRASLRENMAVIERMLRALVSGGPAAVPPVPAHLMVPPASAGPAEQEAGNAPGTGASREADRDALRREGAP
jgi:glycosyltransferase involved in cell wall biosynthesis